MNEYSSDIPKGVSALIVDDSRATRRILTKQLNSLDISVDEAGSGKEGLAKLQDPNNKYSIIFSDLEMPEINGFEFCSRYMQADFYNGTPIVIVSTRNDSKSVIQALKLGAEDFIPKPFERDMISKIIGRVFANDDYSPKS